MSHHARGFTLLEVLIAIAIFSLLGLASYRMLSSVISSDEHTRQHELTLRELSRAINALDRDILQIAQRSVRDGYGEPRGALLVGSPLSQTGAALEFTRGGWRNPLGQPRAELQRVRWQLNNTTLQRLYWPVLDQAQDTRARQQNVLKGVSAVHLRLLDQQGQWHTQWPPQDSLVADINPYPPLPRAMEVIIHTQAYGEVRRMYRLPGGAQQLPQEAQ